MGEWGDFTPHNPPRDIESSSASSGQKPAAQQHPLPALSHEPPPGTLLPWKVFTDVRITSLLVPVTDQHMH